LIISLLEILYTNLRNFFNSSKGVRFKFWKMGEWRWCISKIYR